MSEAMSEQHQMKYDDEVHNLIQSERQNQQRFGRLSHSDRMRREKLLTWFGDMCEEEQRISCKSKQLAIIYIDCIMETYTIPNNKLQLLALVALLVAVKLQESWAYRIDEIAEIINWNNTVQEIKEMEISILRGLRWKLLQVTPSELSDLFIAKYYSSLNHRFSQTVSMLQTYCFTCYEFVGMRSSSIAVATLQYALFLQKRKNELQELQSFLETSPEGAFDNAEIYKICNFLPQLLYQASGSDDADQTKQNSIEVEQEQQTQTDDQNAAAAAAAAGNSSAASESTAFSQETQQYAQNEQSGQTDEPIYESQDQLYEELAHDHDIDIYLNSHNPQTPDFPYAAHGNAQAANCSPMFHLHHHAYTHHFATGVNE